MFIVRGARNNEVIGATSKPNYITQSDTGAFILVDKRAARGIAFEGSPYNLLGETPMERTVGTVYVTEEDDGAAIFQGAKAQADADALSVDHEFRLTAIELGLTE